MPVLAQTTLPVGNDTLALAVEWLEAAGQRAGWPTRTVFKLRLCLDETLTNTLMYGYTPDIHPEGGPRVMLTLHEDGPDLKLEILDNGNAFDPTARTPRALDASLDDAQVGGHGLRLLRHYLEDMRYERRGGWNLLTLLAAVDDAP